jgi:hypothetical protein
MKKFNEWRAEVEQTENPDLLMGKIQELAHQLEVELDAFTGERFEGFLNLIGNVKNLKRTLSEIEHGCVGQTPQYQTMEDAAARPSSPRGMKKLGYKQDISKKVRKMEDDLSSDYKGHIGMNGEEQPLKVMKKKK